MHRGPATNKIADANEVPADTPVDRRPHLGEFDIELRCVDHRPCGLYGLLCLALVGDSRIHLFLRGGVDLEQLLGPSEILVCAL